MKPRTVRVAPSTKKTWSVILLHTAHDIMGTAMVADAHDKLPHDQLRTEAVKAMNIRSNEITDLAKAR